MACWPSKSGRRTDLIQRPGRAILSALALACAAAQPVGAQAPLGDFSAFAVGPQSAGKPQTGLSIIPLTLERRGKPPLAYRVEVAATPDQQATGMMFRRTMAPATGMLFPMNPPRETAFWMRNTLIPLDLVFIGPDGRIIRIHASARPLNDAPLPSGGKVKAVLELAGGEAARIGLKPGDVVRW